MQKPTSPFQLKFKKLLDSLNPAQLEAVQTTEGPVLTIAGPGTGKTHILAARIGQILQLPDVHPSNILCLTFTDAAVHAMRKRLLQFIGIEAHKVHIFTFHSFCNKVIQDNLESFGYVDLSPITELERIDLLRELIDQLPAQNPLKKHKRDPYFYERHLHQLFQLMKSESWTVEEMQDAITNHLEEIPFLKEFIYQRKSGSFKKGDLKKHKLNEVSERMHTLKAAINCFAPYQALLKQYRLYDFADMLLWVLKAFEENDSLLGQYQEQYQYLLVDEFQDTNGAQSNLIQQLVAYWNDDPNLFIVGDDDQSIYEFQGARLKNMTDLYERYKSNLLLVLLSNNYRSSQHILNSAQACIESNKLRLINQLTDLKIDKKLIAANEQVAQINTPVYITAFQNAFQEEVAILQHIERLRENKVPLHEIAIIYAKHRQSDQLIELLSKKQIPYNSKRHVNLLELPIIQNLKKLFEYIALEQTEAYSGEHLFFELLFINFIKIDQSDATKLSAWVSRETQKQLRKQAYDDLPLWRNVIQDTVALEAAKVKAPEDFIALSAFIETAIAQVNNMNTAQFVQFFMTQSGLLNFTAKHSEKGFYTEVLNTFFDFVKKEEVRQKTLSLKGLLYTMQQMDANRIPINLYQIDAAESGVNLITAHSAKGLEFRYVFMLHCNKQYWEPSSNKGSRQFKLPDTLNPSNDSDSIEAARRLFFVAMTRAEQALYISYHIETTKHKTSSPCQFVDELLEQKNASVSFNQAPPQSSTEYQLLQLQQAPSTTTIGTLLEKPLIDNLLQDFRMSISALNSYLYCPLSFYYEYVLKLPALYSPEAAYGIAVHNALKRLFDLAEKNKASELPELHYFLDYFRIELKKQQINLNKKQFQTQLELGMEHLPRYYKQRKSPWNKLFKEAKILTEQPLKNVAWNGIPLTGTLDKAIIFGDKTNKRVHLVDYKTGLLDNKRLNKGSKRNIKGGSYWRQLIFYKILFEQSNISQYSVHSAEIDYLSPNFNFEFPIKTLDLSPDDVALVKTVIEDSYQKIMAHDFEKGCGKDSCKWCNFTNRNISPEDFSNPEIEVLDDY